MVCFFHWRCRATSHGGRAVANAPCGRVDACRCLGLGDPGLEAVPVSPWPYISMLEVRNAVGAVKMILGSAHQGTSGESRTLRGQVKASGSGGGAAAPHSGGSRVEGVEAGGYQQKVSSGPRGCEGGWSLNHGWGGMNQQSSHPRNLQPRLYITSSNNIIIIIIIIVIILKTGLKITGVK